MCFFPLKTAILTISNLFGNVTVSTLNICVFQIHVSTLDNKKVITTTITCTLTYAQIQQNTCLRQQCVYLGDVHESHFIQRDLINYPSGIAITILHYCARNVVDQISLKKLNFFGITKIDTIFVKAYVLSYFCICESVCDDCKDDSQRHHAQLPIQKYPL